MRSASEDGNLPLGEVLRRTIIFFKRHGVQDPRLDAEVLLAHVLDRERIDLYVNYDQPLTGEETSRYRKLVLERARGKPVAYLVGEKEFMSLKFIVDERVLIPRPETELVVEEALQFLKPDKSDKPDEGRGVKGGLGDVEADPLTMVDLGTGSGCIAVSVAYFARREGYPLGRVYAVDTGEEILEVARSNARKHGVEGCVEFAAGDLFRALDPSLESSIHLLCSNPPYVPGEVFSELRPEVRSYEPRKALFGGRDGLAYYRRIIPRAPRWLAPGGMLFLEMGEGQGGAIELLLEESGFGTVEIRKDYASIPRVIRATLGPPTNGWGGG